MNTSTKNSVSVNDTMAKRKQKCFLFDFIQASTDHEADNIQFINRKINTVEFPLSYCFDNLSELAQIEFF